MQDEYQDGLDIRKRHVVRMHSKSVSLPVVSGGGDVVVVASSQRGCLDFVLPVVSRNSQSSIFRYPNFEASYSGSPDFQ